MQSDLVYVGNTTIQLLGIIDVDSNKSPRVGFEPTTNRLTADRSTAELPRKVLGDSVSYTLKDLCSLNRFSICKELSFLRHFLKETLHTT